MATRIVARGLTEHSRRPLTTLPYPSHVPTLRLVANDFEPRRGRDGEHWNRDKLGGIDLRWHDLRHEGACRLLVDGVDIRLIQLMLGHSTLRQTQRYLNVTDDEMRTGMQVSWDKRRLKLVAGTGASPAP